MPSSKEIRELYRDVRHLFGVRHLDLYSLEKFIPDDYQPGDSPLVMVVGAGYEEPFVIRKYFERKGIDDIVLVGCNTRMMLPKETKGYDAVASGVMFGDGANVAIWKELAYEMGREDYDMAIFRFPDFHDTVGWYGAYNQAVHHVREGGIIVTITKKEDIGRYNKVMDMLKDRNGVDHETIKTEITGKYVLQDYVGIIEVSGKNADA